MPNPMATETLTPAPSATPVEGSGGLLLNIDGKIVPNYAATMVSFDEGDVVNGKVVRIDKDEVLVDIGYKAEGVIPSNELSIRKSVNPAEEVELGEEVDALVLTKEDAEGRLILSKKRARFEKAWRRIEVAADSGEPVEGSVIEVVKGGLILDLGVRGFLPASLVDIRRVHNLDEFMGQTLECKVIELNRSRNNVVLSRRAVLEEERKEVREQILGRLEPGQVVEGKISNIVDFGAFVDLDGIDGLIHISELSWSHVNHPSEVVAIGDTVRIKVLDIDRDRQRISLGLKQTQEDPWQRVISTHRPGDVLEGTVTKVVAFGAFVEILPGVEGLVHISELADHHVENPSEVVEPGAKLNVKILEIDEDRRRLSLSIKRVEGQNMPMQDLSAQIAAANAANSGEAVADGGAEEAAIDLAEDSAVESQEVESPAVEAETVAAEVPEGATAEAAIEDTSQAEAAEAPADEIPTAEAAPEAETPAAEAAPEPATSEPEAVAEAPAAESSESQEGSEDNGEGDAGEAHEGESASERPDSPDSADEAASGGDSDSESSEQD
jgi:small subunit ribosomal protein S1